ncbi:MAG: aminodeoxychorismate/anthranilate synthase component II [Bacteroidetes bacterium]|nr:aminodeoxychorismate/anthranilate synthase component II [Bacteroidota bacterium]
MKILLIDNYDSFTFNLVELLRPLGMHEITLVKNDEVNQAIASNFDRIIISPGPATPSESGNVLEVIQQCASTHSILGICLGHQAIAEAFGGKLYNLNLPYHGYQTEIIPVENLQTKQTLYQNLQVPIRSGLYHSWVVSETDLPDCLEITAYSKEGYIMGIKHTKYDVEGIQFHPESYMTDCGKILMQNWLNRH